MAVRKGKIVALAASLPLAELAKPLVKVAIGLVEGLIQESYPGNELLAKQFYLN